jgi:hypothetical protein
VPVNQPQADVPDPEANIKIDVWPSDKLIDVTAQSVCCTQVCFHSRFEDSLMVGQSQ